MKAEDFLNQKRIPKPTYEGVRLVDNRMGAYRIVDLLEEYADIITKEVNGVDTSKDKCTLHGVTNWVAIDRLPSVECFYLVYDKTYGMITKALFTNAEFHCIENMDDLEITHWCSLPKPPCL